MSETNERKDQGVIEKQQGHEQENEVNEEI